MPQFQVIDSLPKNLSFATILSYSFLPTPMKLIQPSSNQNQCSS